jgi:acyl-coenzyme A synthetase/AMP-(fatty) acid ligase
MNSASSFNFTADVFERLARERPRDEALRTIDAGGSVRSFSFSEVEAAVVRLSGGLATAGIGSGDVVMTLMGARAEWVFTLLAAWRMGAAALPCSEQLRSKDIALRIELARPQIVLAAATWTSSSGRSPQWTPPRSGTTSTPRVCPTATPPRHS